MILTSVVICVAALFSLWVNNKPIATAFATSLAFIIPTMTIIEFVVGVLSPSQFQDNWGIITILCLMAFEWFLIYAIIKRYTKSIQQ